jgi:imidazole glycerol-phosphate synthase subunit HisH
LSKISVTVVDYKMGNQASVVHCLRELGYRVRVSDDLEVLDTSDIVILPGVGAYPSAMKELHNKGLVTILQERARKHHPIIGICLGMQLLAEASFEHQYTAGLGLIPGEVIPLNDPKWHIGWNTLDCVKDDPNMQLSDGKAFYFNHSLAFDGPNEYHICVSHHKKTFPVVIRKGNVVGLQFHPEKSQGPGRELLRNLIEGMCNA